MRKVIGAALISLTPVALAAQQTKPWGSRDFTFHRVAAPPRGGVPHLVQIDPNATPYSLTPALPEGSHLKYEGGPAAAATGPSDWFWSGVSPSLAASNPGRLGQAVGQLQLASAPVAPPAAKLAQLVRTYGDVATKQAAGTLVSPALVLAVIAVESGGDAKALSRAGAQGLMQLMPDTARRFGVDDPLNADQSIAGGVAYLNFLLRAFGEDPILTLAAYNAGEGAVAQNKGVPPYPETRAYVPKVLGAWTVARLFCRVPPETVTDPCQFTAQAAADAVAAAGSGKDPAPSAGPGGQVAQGTAKGGGGNTAGKNGTQDGGTNG